jgi:polyhydroxyalkanoate synthesis regulator phasin
MSEEITDGQPGVAEPAVATAAQTDDTPAGGTGVDPVGARNEGFLKILEGKTEPEPKVEEPTKEPESKTPEPKPDEKPDAEKKDEPEAKAPDAKAEEDAEADDEDLELLSREELDKKFPNSPKGVRSYAAAVAKKFQPYAEAIDELGGIEAVKRLDTLRTVALSSPQRPDAPEIKQFLEDIGKTNPQFRSMLNTNVFYGAIDENPELLESVIKTAMGPDWSGEKLKMVAQLVKDGELDLDEIQEVASKKLPPEEIARREAQTAADKKRDDEIAELRKSQEETAASKKADQIKADVEDLGQKFNEARESVFKRFNLLPVKGDPEDVAKMKVNVIKEAILEASLDLSRDPLMQSIDAMVSNQTDKGDGYNWAVLKAASKLRAKTTEILLRKQPLITAYLKTYNQPAADNAQTRRPEPLADGALARERETPTQQAQDQEPLSVEERNKRFLATVEGKTGTR